MLKNAVLTVPSVSVSVEDGANEPPVLAVQDDAAASVLSGHPCLQILCQKSLLQRSDSSVASATAYYYLAGISIGWRKM